MKYEKVLKFLEIVGSVFIIVSLIEIAYLILLNFTEFIIDGNSMLLFEFVYSSSIFPFSGSILWLFMNISSLCFLILGIFMFRLSSNKNIETIPLAKFIVVIGMIIVLGAFVKMDFLVLLGNTNIISTITNIPFQFALYDTYITDLMPAIFWIYFISLNIFFMISGLGVTGTGIKWTLQQEEANKNKER
ncbi:MAG: hypothetical protein ACFFA0_00795 [Promethearchaeota archaeon]